jgi:hypothetical protein
MKGRRREDKSGEGGSKRRLASRPSSGRAGGGRSVGAVVALMRKIPVLPLLKSTYFRDSASGVVSKLVAESILSIGGESLAGSSPAHSSFVFDFLLRWRVLPCCALPSVPSDLGSSYEQTSGERGSGLTAAAEVTAAPTLGWPWVRLRPIGLHSVRRRHLQHHQPICKAAYLHVPAYSRCLPLKQLCEDGQIERGPGGTRHRLRDSAAVDALSISRLGSGSPGRRHVPPIVLVDAISDSNSPASRLEGRVTKSGPGAADGRRRRRRRRRFRKRPRRTCDCARDESGRLDAPAVVG